MLELEIRISKLTACINTNIQEAEAALSQQDLEQFRTLIFGLSKALSSSQVFKSLNASFNTPITLINKALDKLGESSEKDKSLNKFIQLQLNALKTKFKTMPNILHKEAIKKVSNENYARAVIFYRAAIVFYKQEKKWLEMRLIFNELYILVNILIKEKNRHSTLINSGLIYCLQQLFNSEYINKSFDLIEKLIALHSIKNEDAEILNLIKMLMEVGGDKLTLDSLNDLLELLGKFKKPYLKNYINGLHAVVYNRHLSVIKCLKAAVLDMGKQNRYQSYCVELIINSYFAIQQSSQAIEYLKCIINSDNKQHIVVDQQAFNLFTYLMLEKKKVQQAKQFYHGYLNNRSKYNSNMLIGYLSLLHHLNDWDNYFIYYKQLTLSQMIEAGVDLKAQKIDMMLHFNVDFTEIKKQASEVIVKMGDKKGQFADHLATQFIKKNQIVSACNYLQLALYYNGCFKNYRDIIEVFRKNNAIEQLDKLCLKYHKNKNYPQFQLLRFYLHHEYQRYTNYLNECESILLIDSIYISEEIKIDLLAFEFIALFKNKPKKSAEDLLTLMLSEHKDQPELLERLSVILIKAALALPALNILNNLIKNEPTLSRLTSRADCFLLLNKHNLAINDLLHAKKIEGADKKINFKILQAYYDSDKYTELDKLTKAMLLENADDFIALYFKAILFVEQKKYSQVVPLYKKIINELPKHSEHINYILACAYSGLKQYDKALSVLEKLITKKTNNKMPVRTEILEMIDILYKQKKWDACIKLAEPFVGVSWENKKIILRCQDAKDCSEKKLPDHPIHKLVNLYWHTKQPKKYIQLMGAYLTIDLSHIDYLKKLTSHYLMSGKLKKVIDYLTLLGRQEKNTDYQIYNCYFKLIDYLIVGDMENAQHHMAVLNQQHQAFNSIESVLSSVFKKQFIDKKLNINLFGANLPVKINFNMNVTHANLKLISGLIHLTIGNLKQAVQEFKQLEHPDANLYLLLSQLQLALISNNNNLEYQRILIGLKQETQHAGLPLYLIMEGIAHYKLEQYGMAAKKLANTVEKPHPLIKIYLLLSKMKGIEQVNKITTYNTPIEQRLIIAKAKIKAWSRIKNSIKKYSTKDLTTEWMQCIKSLTMLVNTEKEIAEKWLAYYNCAIKKNYTKGVEIGKYLTKMNREKNDALQLFEDNLPIKMDPVLANNKRLHDFFCDHKNKVIDKYNLQVTDCMHANSNIAF